MKIIDHSHEILNISHHEPLKAIESYGRTCYKSEERITENSSEKFVRMLIKNGHHSVLEHVNITVKFITDRGVTHELVRHRLASYSQESTRYCNYFNKVEFIKPVWLSDDIQREIWEDHMFECALKYNKLLNLGWRTEQARSILPNSLKTEIVMTANIREWRHVLKLRTSKSAHPQIRKLMLGFLDDLNQKLPDFFEDIL